MFTLLIVCMYTHRLYNPSFYSCHKSSWSLFINNSLISHNSASQTTKLFPINDHAHFPPPPRPAQRNPYHLPPFFPIQPLLTCQSFNHQPHSLFHPSLHPQPASTPSRAAQPNPNPAHHHHPFHHNHAQPHAHAHPQRTMLSMLRVDETATLHRRESIRRYGATWLRPMGIGKTLQGTDDERAEREEAEGGRLVLSSSFSFGFNFPSVSRRD